MRLFVTGGAGNTGCEFLKQFLDDHSDNTAVVLVRSDTRLSYLPKMSEQRVQIVVGDLKNGSVSRLMEGSDAVMHIAHQTLCPQVADSAAEAGVRRVFFVTTTGVFSKFNDLSENYQRIEESIRSSALDWTILRPSMIFGNERDANLHKLLRFLDRRPVFPIFGDGMSLMQPVYVGDLAAGLLRALKNANKTIAKEYNLCGRNPLTYNQIVETAIHLLERDVRIIHIPHKLSLLLASVGETLLKSRSPVKAEQVRRLSEDKSYSWLEAEQDFQYEPGSFTEGLTREIGRLREIGLLQEK